MSLLGICGLSYYFYTLSVNTQITMKPFLWNDVFWAQCATDPLSWSNWHNQTRYERHIPLFYHVLKVGVVWQMLISHISITTKGANQTFSNASTIQMLWYSKYFPIKIHNFKDSLGRVLFSYFLSNVVLKSTIYHSEPIISIAHRDVAKI